MTREEILRMPAGRWMDALIAERFFGWCWVNNLTGSLIVPPSDHPAMVNNWAAEWDEFGTPNWLPHYSTDIAAAWEVVENLKSKPALPTIEQVQRRIEYLMELAVQGRHSTTIGGGELRGYFGTPPGYTASILRWSVKYPTPRMRELSRSISMED